MASVSYALSPRKIVFSSTFFQKIGGGLAVMGLAGGEHKVHRAAFGIDKSVDLGRQPAAGTSHAAIVRAPLFPVAPMLMDPDAGRVDHDDIAVISL